MKELDPKRLRHLEGFGRTRGGDVYLYEIDRTDELPGLFEIAKKTGRKVVLRGAGRSYGDAAYAAEQIGVSLNRLNNVLEWDPRTGVVTAEAGITIDQLCRFALPQGWWPNAVGGTSAPTLAGALSQNIHGKNHGHSGTLGESVIGMEVYFPSTGTRWLAKTDEMFSWTIGGLGLLGVITKVKLQFVRSPMAYVRVRRPFLKNWEEQFAAFEGAKTDSANSLGTAAVSWIDGFATGSHFGRGIFEQASDCESSEPWQARALQSPIHKHAWRVLKAFNNRGGMRLVNQARLLTARLRGTQATMQDRFDFNFPLDQYAGWERAYLPGGLIQFQAIIPEANAREVLPRLVAQTQKLGLPSFLVVMKRHRGTEFPFTYALDGYSLAMDFPLTFQNRVTLVHLYRELVEIALAGEGRFYLAKDELLLPNELELSVGAQVLNQFRSIKRACDPEGLLTSALGERLALV